MSNHTEGNYISREAAADLSLKQYHLVKTDANGLIVLASAATDDILGVLMNAPVLGEIADVALINGNGTGKVKAGDAITKGAYLTADAEGKAVATVTTGNRVFGRASFASAADGDVLEYVKYNERHQ